MSGLQQILVYSGDSESEEEDELVPEMSTSGTPPPDEVPMKRNGMHEKTHQAQCHPLNQSESSTYLLRIPSLVSNRSSKGTNSSDLEPITPRKERHRVTMMGAARVGKSSIISQFLYEKYLSRYKQTVEDMHRGEYELPDGSCLTLDILDTSGSYQFPAMRALSINISGAFILVYAVDDEETWLEVERLREQIVEARGLRVPIVIVGNKADIPEEDRQVQQKEAQTKATLEWGCGYAECSAKNNEGILTVFKQLLRQANIEYNLSPAVRRRRKSLPNYASSQGQGQNRPSTARYYLKRHSCSVQ